MSWWREVVEASAGDERWWRFELEPERWWRLA